MSKVHQVEFLPDCVSIGSPPARIISLKSGCSTSVSRAFCQRLPLLSWSSMSACMLLNGGWVQYNLRKLWSSLLGGEALPEIGDARPDSARPRDCREPLLGISTMPFPVGLDSDCGIQMTPPSGPHSIITRHRAPPAGPTSARPQIHAADLVKQGRNRVLFLGS